MRSWVFVWFAAIGCKEEETEPQTDPHEARCPDPLEICAGDAGCVLDIDLHPYTLSGALSYDGAPLVSSGGWDWSLRFVDGAGRATSVSLPGGATYAAPVLPGTYDVFFELLRDEATADPVEGELRVASGLVVEGDETLDIVVQPVTLGGAVSWNGRPLVHTGELDWALTLTESGSGVPRQIALPGGATYTARVYPGSYDISARLIEADAAETDTFGEIPLAEAQVIGADATFDVAVDFAHLTGPLTRDGAPLGATGESFTIVFRAVDGPSVVSASVPAGPTWEMWVPPGTYDVDFFNVRLAEGVVVDGEGGFPIDLRSEVELSGSVTYDGAPVPYYNNDPYGSLIVVETTTGWVATAELAASPQYAATFPAGTYDVYFSLAWLLLVDRPAEGLARVTSDLELTADTVLDVDVRVGTLRVTPALAGDPAWNPRGPYPLDLELTEPTSGETITLDAHTAVTSEITVFQGPYDVAAGAATGGFATPVDGVRPVGSVTVGDEEAYPIAIDTVEVAGRFTWDDAPLADDPIWRLVFTDPVTGESHGARFAGGSYAAATFPGIWDVSVELVDPWTFPAEIYGPISVAECVRLR